jgi:nucleoside-diphosphate-sugar epimerase
MPDKKIIVITGANGFIGSAVAKRFVDQGWVVHALVKTQPEKPITGVEYYSFDMNGAVPEAAFEGAEALLHFAYIKNDIETNIRGTAQLLEASRTHGLRKNIFMSSFSARDTALSKYGQQKFAVEKLFNTDSDCVIRAGIVLGRGGLYQQIAEYIRKGARIPLIDGGMQPMQSIYIDDLVACIEKIITDNRSGTYTLAEPTPVSYKDFVTAVSEKVGKKPKFVPVPFFLLDIAMRLAGVLHLPLPVTRENIFGLKYSEARDTQADIQRLGVHIRNYQESLNSLYS